MVDLNFLNCPFLCMGLPGPSRENSGKVVMSVLFCGSVEARRARVSALYHAFPARVFTCSNISDTGELLALALA